MKKSREYPKEVLSKTPIAVRDFIVVRPDEETLLSPTGDLQIKSADNDRLLLIAEALAMRLGDQLREHPAREGGATIRVTASFGVATARAGEDWAALFARADRALYEAKSAGRDRVIVA